MNEGENIPYVEPSAHWRVEVAGFGGPIAREWFDECGNYHTLYENGAESVISAEVLADARTFLEGSDGV